MALQLDTSLLNRLSQALAERFSCNVCSMGELLATTTFEEWGGIRVLDGGDRICVSTRPFDSDDSREACWVEVRGLHVQMHLMYSPPTQFNGESEIRNQQRCLMRQVSHAYSRLNRVLSFALPSSPDLGIHTPLVLAYGAITTVKLDNEPDLMLERYFYTTEGPVVMVDVSDINRLIGRFHCDSNCCWWCIIDRKSCVSRSLYTD
jgi:hypothetical protein